MGAGCSHNLQHVHAEAYVVQEEEQPILGDIPANDIDAETVEQPAVIESVVEEKPAHIPEEDDPPSPLVPTINLARKQSLFRQSVMLPLSVRGTWLPWALRAALHSATFMPNINPSLPLLDRAAVCRINQYRIPCGLEPFVYSDDFQQDAQQHAQFMLHHFAEKPAPQCDHYSRYEPSNKALYSAQGNEVAQGSLSDVAITSYHALEQIAAAPFKRLAMLTDEPWLIAIGTARNERQCAAVFVPHEEGDDEATPPQTPAPSGDLATAAATPSEKAPLLHSEVEPSATPKALSVSAAAVASPTPKRKAPAQRARPHSSNFGSFPPPAYDHKRFLLFPPNEFEDLPVRYTADFPDARAGLLVVPEPSVARDDHSGTATTATTAAVGDLTDSVQTTSATAAISEQQALLKQSQVADVGGFPASVLLRQSDAKRVESVTAIYRDDTSGENLACWVSTPARPARATATAEELQNVFGELNETRPLDFSRLNMNLIVITPQKALLKGHRYTVDVTITLLPTADGRFTSEQHKLQWRFATRRPTNWRVYADAIHEYQTLQFALNAAEDDDIIHLSPGQHAIAPLVIRKRVSLVGCGLGVTKLVRDLGKSSKTRSWFTVISEQFTITDLAVAEDGSYAFLQVRSVANVHMENLRFVNYAKVADAVLLVEPNGKLTVRCCDFSLSEAKIAVHARALTSQELSSGKRAIGSVELHENAYFWRSPSKRIGTVTTPLRAAYFWVIRARPKRDEFKFDFALTHAQAGDTLLLAADTYPVTNWSDIHLNITLRGSTKSATILRVASAAADTTRSAVCLLSSCQAFNLENMTIQSESNAPLVKQAAPAGPCSITLRDVVLVGFANCAVVEANAETRLLFSHCDFTEYDNAEAVHFAHEGCNEKNVKFVRCVNPKDSRFIENED